MPPQMRICDLRFFSGIPITSRCSLLLQTRKQASCYRLYDLYASMPLLSLPNPWRNLFGALCLSLSVSRAQGPSHPPVAPLPTLAALEDAEGGGPEETAKLGFWVWVRALCVCGLTGFRAWVSGRRLLTCRYFFPFHGRRKPVVEINFTITAGMAPSIATSKALPAGPHAVAEGLAGRGHLPWAILVNTILLYLFTALQTGLA